MRFDEAYSGNVFIGSSHDFTTSRVVLYGMPMDWTASFRPGSRLGPARIREASLVHEEYSHYLRRDLSEIQYFDAGDIPLAFGNPQRSLEQISVFVQQLLSYEKIPFGIGGEHLVTWPIVKEIYTKYPDLVVLHFDAHADLREDYEGEVYSHATPMRKIAERIGGENLYQFGIRSMTREEATYAEEAGIHFYPFAVIEPLKQIIPTIKDRPVYVSIDIDVLDPAFAPGTGTPDSGGITSQEMFTVIHTLAAAELQIVGADLVEVAPAYDPTEQTVVLAGKMIREMLLGLFV
ncbi:agmatinase [Seinonella peptonophila]|uniref:Agmatinase n=1 Tax=Seinonella peptonophila TaxID=112248 RepID=A0A1M4WX78_9BACL|nr:agmatinase [Seinonella peptonophila]SHE85572.1 agmatinase [Seinonella peptonophila]